MVSVPGGPCGWAWGEYLSFQQDRWQEKTGPQCWRQVNKQGPREETEAEIKITWGLRGEVDESRDEL